MTTPEMTTTRSVLLVGGPDAGKSNYLGRLWMALDSGRGVIAKDGLPSQMEYVRQLADALLRGEFAKHSSHGFFQENIIPVQWPENNGTARGQLVVPDCAGELWERIHRLREWDEHWESPVRSLAGCLLFFRADSSHHVPALDWSTDEGMLKCLSALPVTNDTNPASSPPGFDPTQPTLPTQAVDTAEPKMPTQVVLVDWLQCLRSAYVGLHRPIRPLRLSIIVAAWDRVPAEQQAKCPDDYLDACVPLLHDFINSNQQSFDTHVFGVSVVGGDLTDAQPGFKNAYLKGEPYKSGYVVYCHSRELQKSEDLTIPVAWAFGCPVESFRQQTNDSR
jgi:Double-GTPase 1